MLLCANFHVYIVLIRQPRLYTKTKQMQREENRKIKSFKTQLVIKANKSLSG